jgi:hypothetical protein
MTGCCRLRRPARPDPRSSPDRLPPAQLGLPRTSCPRCGRARIGRSCRPRRPRWPRRCRRRSEWSPPRFPRSGAQQVRSRCSSTSWGQGWVKASRPAKFRCPAVSTPATTGARPDRVSATSRQPDLRRRSRPRSSECATAQFRSAAASLTSPLGGLPETLGGFAPALGAAGHPPRPAAAEGPWDMSGVRVPPVTAATPTSRHRRVGLLPWQPCGIRVRTSVLAANSLRCRRSCTPEADRFLERGGGSESLAGSPH